MRLARRADFDADAERAASLVPLEDVAGVVGADAPVVGQLGLERFEVARGEVEVFGAEQPVADLAAKQPLEQAGTRPRAFGVLARTVDDEQVARRPSEHLVDVGVERGADVLEVVRQVGPAEYVGVGAGEAVPVAAGLHRAVRERRHVAAEPVGQLGELALEALFGGGLCR